MKTLKIALLALIVAATVSSCDDTGDSLSRVTLTVNLTLPDGAAGASAVSHELAVTNLSTATTATYSTLEGIVLEEGLFTFTYDGEYSQSDGTTIHVKAYAPSTQITAGNHTITLSGYVDASNEDFIIREIFYTGTLRPSGNQYTGDEYVIIYNNTDHVLYADGLSFVESKFLTVNKYNYSPDIIDEAMTVDAVYTIPGDGTEHPVEPGGSLMLVDNGLDHRTLNEYSFDLSHADFEWYDVSTSAANMDIDSPEVPNLDKWYCYTLSYFVLHNRGFKAYALARIPVDQDTYVGSYLYTYYYDLVTSAGTFPMSQSAYRLPNEWIVDVVNLSVAAEYEWNVCTAALDRGYAYCGEIDHDMNRYFKSVRRKFLYLKDGRVVVKDTNNSSEDFNSNVVPSEIERQGTVMDASGNCATTITYDGVTPVE